jgi:Tfp pilus assembly protein PilO
MKRLTTFYIFLLSSFALVSVAFLSLGIFGYLTLSNIQGSITEQKYRLDILSKRYDILSSLEKKYTLVEPDIAKINTALPDQKDASKLVSDLDTLAKGAGLKLTMIQSATAGKKATSEDQSLLQTVKGTYGYELPLEIKVEGAFTAYTGFVKQLENYQRLMNITSMEITKPTGMDAGGDYIEAKLKIMAYLKK